MVERKVSILAVLEDRLSRPLGQITKRFKGVERGVKRLSRALAPLNSQILSLGVGLAGLGGGAKALELAKQQIQAEQTLLSALEGRTKELEKIKKVASEIQNETIVGDESLLETAALLIRMGVDAREVPKALAVSVDLAAAFNIQLEQVAKGLGLAASAGRAGLLGQRLPFIEDMLKNGAEIGEILDVITEKFGGAGAALAEGPFGQAEQLSNAIGDSMEELGKVLITFVVPVLDKVNAGMTTFVTLLGDDRVVLFLQFATELAPVLVTIASALAGLAVAAGAITIIGPGLTAIGSGLLGIAGIVGSIVAFFASWPGIIALVVFQLGKMLGIWGAIKSAISNAFSSITGSVSSISELFGLVVAGKADFEELFALIGVELENFGLKIKKNVFSPIKFVFNAVKDLVLGTIDVVLAVAIGSALTFVDKFLQIFQGAVNLVILGLNQLGAGLENISIGNILDDDIEKFQQLAKDGAEQAGNAIVNAYAILQEEQEQLHLQIRLNNIEAAEISATAVEKAFERAKSAILAEGEEGVKQIFILNAAIDEALDQAGGVQFNSDDLFADLNLSSVRKALDGLSEESQKALTTVIQSEIQRRFNAEEISAAEFFAFRIGLEKQVSLEALASTDAQIEAKRDLVDQLDTINRRSEDYLAREQQTLELMENEGKSVEDRTKQLKKVERAQEGLLDSTRNQATAATDLLKLEQKRADLEVQRATFRASVSTERTGLADAIIAEVEAARATLQAKREEIANQILTGEILPSEGIQLSSAALNEFIGIADEAETELLELFLVAGSIEQAALNAAIGMVTFGATTSVVGAEAVEHLEAILEKLKQIKGEASDPGPEGGFWDSFGTSIERTANQLGNFADQGKRIGTEFITGLGKGLVDVWSDGEKSFKDFAKTFGANILKMIAQMLLFNAISRGIKALGFGAGAPGPAANTGGLFTGNDFSHRFNSGGYVPGAHTGKDDVNAKLTAGEYVTDYDTVKYYGLNWFKAMKQRKIPRTNIAPVAAAPPVAKAGYAHGGPVVAPTAGGGSGRSYVISDEQSFDRLARGGRASLLDILAEEGFRPA